MTWAAFQSGMSRSEMGFLYRATDYSDYDGVAKSRFAAGEDSFIYRFDLADAVREAVFYVNVTGDYQIEASADDLHWTVLEKGNVQEKTTLVLDASKVIETGSPLYLRFGDRTPENGGGLELYSLQLMTDAASMDTVEIRKGEDAAYKVAEEPGTCTYLLPLSGKTDSGDIVIAAKEVSAQISSDNQSFTELPLHQQGADWYGQLSGITGTLYLKLTAWKRCVFRPRRREWGS